LAHILKQIPQ